MTLKIILLLMLTICLPAMAQDNPIRLRIQQTLAESTRLFGKGQYAAGALRVENAARMLRSRPDAYPESTPVALAGKAVDYLTTESAAAKAHGDDAAAQRALQARQSLLRSLRSWEPQNPRWSGMLTGQQQGEQQNDSGFTHMQNRSAGQVSNPESRYTGRSIGGARMEPRTFAGAGTKQQYQSRFSLTGKDLNNVRGRARVDWSKLPIPRAGSGGGSQGSNCPNCGHYMAPGVSWCTSCSR